MAFAARCSMPWRSRVTLVTNRSSPTSCSFPPSVRERLPAVPIVLGHAVLDGDDRIARGEIGIKLGHAAGLERLALAFQMIFAVAEEFGRGGSRARERSGRPACSRLFPPRGRRSRAPHRPISGSARSRPHRRHWCCARHLSAACADCGRSPRPCAERRRNVSAPAGMIMNSWKSSALSAWAPPLMMFIIGTGSTRALTPPRY